MSNIRVFIVGYDKGAFATKSICVCRNTFCGSESARITITPRIKTAVRIENELSIS